MTRYTACQVRLGSVLVRHRKTPEFQRVCLNERLVVEEVSKQRAVVSNNGLHKRELLPESKVHLRVLKEDWTIRMT